MPALTNQRREAFVRNVFKSPKTGWSQARCYEAAGYKATGHARDAAASRLLTFGEVKMRLSEMSQPVTRRAQVSMQALLAELDDTIAAAKADRAHGAVIAAYGLIVKIAQMMHDQVEHQEFAGNLTSAEIEAMIVEEYGADAVEKMADDLRAAAIRSASDKAKPVESKKRRKQPKPATD
jgi:hypothetical protein